MNELGGRALGVVGQVLVGLGWLGTLVLIPSSRVLDWGLGATVALAFGVSVLLSVGVWLKNRSKRHLALDVATLRARDPRPPIVYLRQFITDEQTDLGQASLGIDTSLEQSLVAAVSSLGPVIALSRPGERLPPPGAARRSATNEEWQAVIEGWLREARLVVLVAASSDNVSWEIGRCVAALSPERLLLIVPFPLNEAGKRQYAAFREKANRLFPQPLPEALSGSGIIAFGPGFSASFLPDTTTALQRGNRYGQSHLLLVQNLRPAFEALGVKARAPSALSPGFRTALWVLAVLAVVGAALISLLLRAPSGS